MVLMSNNQVKMYKEKTLLRGFARLQRSALRVLQKYVDSDTAKEVNNAVLSEYKKIAEKVPYIGGSGNPFTPILIFSAQILSYIKILKYKCMDADTIGAIINEIGKDIANSFSPIIIKIGKVMFFSPIRLSSLKRRAQESKKKQFMGDWVYSFSMDGKTEFRLDYHECGIHKLYKELGYEEFVKYVCELDFLIDSKLGAKLERTKTIGNGYDVCDFRYSKCHKS